MKRRKLLIALTAAITAVALIAGGTYAWFVSESPVTKNVYASGSLKIEYVNPPQVFDYDATTGRYLKAAITTDPVTGDPIWDPNLANAVYWGGFQPGELYPDTSLDPWGDPYEPAITSEFKNVGSLDAIVMLQPEPQLLVLSRAPLAAPGNPARFQFRSQPDKTAVDFDPVSGLPVYVSQRAIPGYAAQCAAAVNKTDLVLLSADFDPASVLNWLDSEVDPAAGPPFDVNAKFEKASLWIDPTGKNQAVYAYMPAAVKPGITPVPVKASFSMDWKTNARYIDNWYNDDGDNLNPADFPLPGTLINFDTGFVATQNNPDAVMDILGIDLYGDLMPAFVTRNDDGTLWPDPPSGWKNDGKVHSLLFIAAHYGSFGGAITPADLIDFYGPGESIVRGPSGASAMDKLRAAAAFVDFEGYMALLGR